MKNINPIIIITSTTTERACMTQAKHAQRQNKEVIKISSRYMNIVMIWKNIASYLPIIITKTATHLQIQDRM